MHFCGENEYMPTRDNLPHSECDIFVTSSGNYKMQKTVTSYFFVIIHDHNDGKLPNYDLSSNKSIRLIQDP